MATSFRAFGSIQSAKDLLEKLEHDVAQLEAEPGDAWAACNVFVTAEHMPEWIAASDNVALAALTNSMPTWLAVVSHLANGAKHFHATRKGNDSVRGLEHTGYAVGWSDDYHERGELIVHLEPAYKLDGLDTITAVELARRVLNYWSPRVP